MLSLSGWFVKYEVGGRETQYVSTFISKAVRSLFFCFFSRVSTNVYYESEAHNLFCDSNIITLLSLFLAAIYRTPRNVLRRRKCILKQYRSASHNSGPVLEQCATQSLCRYQISSFLVRFVECVHSKLHLSHEVLEYFQNQSSIWYSRIQNVPKRRIHVFNEWNIDI